MLIHLLAITIGIGLLVWGSERFVSGAAAIARNSGLPPLVIGLTIVGFGTSAPELFVSGMAAWKGNPQLAIGNALGSNIANIALVLGVSALITPLLVNSRSLKREYPLMFAIMLLAWWLLHDNELGRLDGGLLLGAAVLLLAAVVMIGLNNRHQQDPLDSEFSSEIPANLSSGKALLWLIAGLVLLLIGAQSIVWGGVQIAQALGISDLIIGLTVIAIGTSLPELATSVTSAYKKEHDIAIGNIIGSNMFNLLPVLALPGLLAPGPLAAEITQRDFPVMVALSIALFIMAYGFRGPGRIVRWEGGLLLLSFVLYQSWLYVGSL